MVVHFANCCAMVEAKGQDIHVFEGDLVDDQVGNQDGWCFSQEDFDSLGWSEQMAQVKDGVTTGLGCEGEDPRQENPPCIPLNLSAIVEIEYDSDLPSPDEGDPLPMRLVTPDVLQDQDKAKKFIVNLQWLEGILERRRGTSSLSYMTAPLDVPTTPSIKREVINDYMPPINSDDVPSSVHTPDAKLATPFESATLFPDAGDNMDHNSSLVNIYVEILMY
eukprot:Gb_11551 [translate_table: standard]